MLNHGPQGRRSRWKHNIKDSATTTAHHPSYASEHESHTFRLDPDLQSDSDLQHLDEQDKLQLPLKAKSEIHEAYNSVFQNDTEKAVSTVVIDPQNIDPKYQKIKLESDYYNSELPGPEGPDSEIQSRESKSQSQQKQPNSTISTSDKCIVGPGPGSNSYKVYVSGPYQPRIFGVVNKKSQNNLGAQVYKILEDLLNINKSTLSLNKQQLQQQQDSTGSGDSQQESAVQKLITPSQYSDYSKQNLSLGSVYDLSEGQVEDWLLSQNPRATDYLLVCGGDGTFSWIVSILNHLAGERERMMIQQQQQQQNVNPDSETQPPPLFLGLPALVPVPLGQCNELGASCGWTRINQYQNNQKDSNSIYSILFDILKQITTVEMQIDKQSLADQAISRIVLAESRDRYKPGPAFINKERGTGTEFEGNLRDSETRETETRDTETSDTAVVVVDNNRDSETKRSTRETGNTNSGDIADHGPDATGKRTQTGMSVSVDQINLQSQQDYQDTYTDGWKSWDVPLNPSIKPLDTWRMVIAIDKQVCKEKCPELLQNLQEESDSDQGKNDHNGINNYAHSDYHTIHNASIGSSVRDHCHKLNSRLRVSEKYEKQLYDELQAEVQHFFGETGSESGQDILFCHVFSSHLTISSKQLHLPSDQKSNKCLSCITSTVASSLKHDHHNLLGPTGDSTILTRIESSTKSGYKPDGSNSDVNYNPDQNQIQQNFHRLPKLNTLISKRLPQDTQQLTLMNIPSVVKDQSTMISNAKSLFTLINPCSGGPNKYGHNNIDNNLNSNIDQPNAGLFHLYQYSTCNDGKLDVLSLSKSKRSTASQPSAGHYLPAAQMDFRSTDLKILGKNWGLEPQGRILCRFNGDVKGCGSGSGSGSGNNLSHNHSAVRFNCDNEIWEISASSKGSPATTQTGTGTTSDHSSTALPFRLLVSPATPKPQVRILLRKDEMSLELRKRWGLGAKVGEVQVKVGR